MSLGAHIKKSVAWLFPSAAIVHGKRHSGNSVEITFDDGPDASNTARILDILSAAEAHATFFLVGNKAHRHPGLVREIHGRGHQIANHGFAHRNARLCSVKEIIEDVERTQAALEDIVGAAIQRDFRPPYGAVTPGSFLALTRRGYRYVFWSIDSRDYATQSADATLANVAGRSRGGDILLFHEDYAHTTVALPFILDEISSRGLICDTANALR